MKCFYHGVDYDGKCSAYWVHKLAKDDEYTRSFYPINYGMKFPFKDIQPNEKVYIVDYSIMPEEMERLLTITTNVIWIDHHASSIKRYENFPFQIAGIRYDGIAACMLTWCWFNTMSETGTGENFEETMTKEAPVFTKYIADYDVWKFEYGEDTKAFEMGLNILDVNPIADIKENIFDSLNCFGRKMERAIIEKGKDLITYRDNWAKEYCECCGFDTEFEGYDCFAMNLAMISSEHFKSINEEEYDVLIGFSYNGKSWDYSLRSTKVDCSQIAMKYGGGGHKGAAGFSSDKLLISKTLIK